MACSLETEPVIVFAPDSGQIDRAIRDLYYRGKDVRSIAKDPAVNRSVTNVLNRIARLRRRGELPYPRRRRPGVEELPDGRFRCRCCGTVYWKRFEARLCCGRP